MIFYLASIYPKPGYPKHPDWQPQPPRDRAQMTNKQRNKQDRTYMNFDFHLLNFPTGKQNHLLAVLNPFQKRSSRQKKKRGLKSKISQKKKRPGNHSDLSRSSWRSKKKRLKKPKKRPRRKKSLRKNQLPRNLLQKRWRKKTIRKRCRKRPSKTKNNERKIEYFYTL